MERIIDIALVFVGAVCVPIAAGVLVLGAVDAVTVACLLLAVISVLVCEWLTVPARIAAPVAYCVLCIVLPAAVPFLPLVAYELARFVREPWPMRGSLFAAVVALVLVGACGGVAVPIALSTAASSLLAAGLSVRTSALIAQRDLTHRTRDDLRERELAHDSPSAEGLFGEAVGELGAEDARRRVFSQLTEREYEVVRLVAEGLDNHEIASAVFASEGTVRNRISSALQKTGYKNRTQLAVAWWRARE